MTPPNLYKRNFKSELTFRTSRSSGPGGQNVNKVNSKVELRFNIAQSILLSDDEKQTLSTKLRSKITREGDLIIISQEYRSQLQNKEAATARFYTLLQTALSPSKKRRPTRRTKASVERRIEKKKQHAAKKADRRYKAL